MLINIIISIHKEIAIRLPLPFFGFNNNNNNGARKLKCAHWLSIVMYYHRPAETREEFNNWLVGFVDGEGCFNIYFSKRDKCFTFNFSVNQHTKDYALLLYIQTKLGVGQLSKRSNRNLCDFQVRNQEDLKKIIIPLFEAHPLLTSKFFNYIKWKKAIEMPRDNDRTESILTLKAKNLPLNYQSPAVAGINIKSAAFLHWVGGFVEADGCLNFHCTRGQVLHAFAITQKLDLIVLQKIQLLLQIDTEFGKKEKNPDSCWLLSTMRNMTIAHIIKTFSTSDGGSIFRGRTSKTFYIWRLSFELLQGQHTQLAILQPMLSNWKKGGFSKKEDEIKYNQMLTFLKKFKPKK